jgi:hypothetical protein
MGVVENQEINEEFFKKKKQEKDPHDLGKITIHNDQEMALLIKYLEELGLGMRLIALRMC